MGTPRRQNLPWFELKPLPLHILRPSRDLIEIYKESIGQGVPMTPILVTSDTDFNWGYIIVNGEHVYRAARELGIETIPCRVEGLESALVERRLRLKQLVS